MLMSTPHRLLDDVRGFFGPNEGRWMRSPLCDVAFDVADERADSLEGAAAHRLAREHAEPRLDHVQPRGALRGEVELDQRMRGEPRLHRRRRVRRRVVEND